ncbi:MAG: DUF2892 domain-containing protein [Saprospiraceae bacterium]|nr:DUF2892 domain-containing protein [Saprospiraceae bacterium]MDW8483948.1 DUF2892 domain-containing protein [Saprospiraceae bacterium]
MKKNVGNLDRIIRTVIALVAALLFFTGIVKDVVGIAVLGIAGVLLLTSAVGFCPIYRLIGLSTCPTTPPR